MKAKRIAIVICAVFLCACVVLAFLLWPQKTKMNLHAVYTNADGTDVTDLGTISLNFTKLRRLFQEDRLYLDLSLPSATAFECSNFDSGSVIYDCTVFQMKDDYIVTNLPCRSLTTNNASITWVGFSQEDGLLILSDPFHEGFYIVASVEDHVNTTEILEFFPVITALANAKE